MELTDSTGDIQDGELRGADAYATHTVSLIRTTPEGGRCVVLMVGDTAGDQMLAAKMVERVLPWLSWQCCVCHTINRILSAIGNIEAVKTLMAEVGRVSVPTCALFGHLPQNYLRCVGDIPVHTCRLHVVGSTNGMRGVRRSRVRATSARYPATFGVCADSIYCIAGHGGHRVV